jgi:hypothetical protein
MHPLPFHKDIGALEWYIDKLLAADASVVGDSGFYVTTYVKELVELLGDRVRIVYPYRPCAEQVESHLRHSQGRNPVTSPEYARSHGIDIGVKDRFYHAHPKFPCGKREALRRRCLAFHIMAHEWELAYPDNFRIFYFKDILSDIQKQAEMLRFLGYATRVVQTGIWENRTQ